MLLENAAYIGIGIVSCLLARRERFEYDFRSAFCVANEFYYFLLYFNMLKQFQMKDICKKF